MSGDILDLIDAATGCQQCEGPLNGSVSDDFCSELCQTTWTAKQVGTEPERDEYAADLAMLAGLMAFYQRRGR
jgi:hypothetical protein